MTTSPIRPVLRRSLQLAERALERAGIYARPLRHLPRGLDWLLDVGRLLGGQPPRVVIDVGANVGQTTLAVKARFPAATVHAFEPVRSSFQALSAAVAHLPAVHCHPLALSNQVGTCTVSIVPGSVFNSLTAPVWHEREKAVEELLTLTTLDRFVAEHRVAPIDLVKVDTEGHDLAVLDGGRESLNRAGARCVYIEVTFNPQNRQSSLFHPILERLNSWGYRFMGLYEIDLFQINPPDLSFCNALFWKSE